MTPLIDATEMYLRTVWELEEEGITPIRARLVERLGLSAPAVSETVTRLEVEGLMTIAPDRTLALTEAGRELAVSVMRKHRLAECLLVDIVGLDWELVHNEACRWEHVISDHVEERIATLLERPGSCPHGNPIPARGDAHSPPDAASQPGREGLRTMAEAAKEGQAATIARMSEMVQGDVPTMKELAGRGLLPGRPISLAMVDGGVHATPVGDETLHAVQLTDEAADLIYVAPLD